MIYATYNKSFVSFILVILIVLCSACSRLNSGDELLGKWIDTKNAKYNLVVERNGENFIIRKTQLEIGYGGVETVNIPATLKDGVLNTPKLLPLTLDRARDVITDGRQDYRRDK